MNRLSVLALTFVVFPLLLGACAKTDSVSNNTSSKAEIPHESDILLGDDGNVSDSDLEQAQHIDIQVNGDGRVVITGIKSASGKIEDHKLSEKDSKELLQEIVKASKGGNKQKLTALIQSHIERLQK